MGDLVVKTNRLNSAVQYLSLVEARIVQLAIVDARESSRGLKVDAPLRINACRYAEAFGVNKSNAYAIIKEAEETLFNRRFSFIDETGRVVKSRWLQRVRYLDNEGSIEVIFAYDVVKQITRIDGAVDFFTSYILGNTIHFKSMYSVRLYELLAQWKNNHQTPIFELGVFRGQLGLENGEYDRMCDFKKRVLDLAIKEINEHSDLTVSYTQHKKGRVIIGFSFEIKPKQATKTKDDRPAWQIKGLTDKQINKLSVYKKEFINANFYDGLLGECIGEQYHDTFNRIIPKLKDPKEVVRFVMIEEILGR